MGRLAGDRLRRIHAAFGVIILSACVALAQAPPALLASPANPGFAVSVIKPSAADTARSILFEPGGRFVARGATVRLLIKIAYDLNDDELDGGPSWIGLKRFDVEATPDTPDAPADTQRRRLRLQHLLADRFQLQMRSEMKVTSTYALVVAKGGPKLKKSQTPDAPTQIHGNLGAMLLTNATVDQLANAVSDWVGHPVLNQTGLDGRYDMKFEWSPDQQSPGSAGSAAAPATPTNDSGPTIFTALQQQLGLSLQARKHQALCKIVERVELPAEN